MYDNNATTVRISVSDWRPTNEYRLRVALIPEEDGTFSAVVLNLPGAGSQGRTEAEALANAREAALGCLEEYQASGEEVPWKVVWPEDVPAGSKERWVTVWKN